MLRAAMWLFCGITMSYDPSLLGSDSLANPKSTLIKVILGLMHDSGRLTEVSCCHALAMSMILPRSLMVVSSKCTK
jgi:hypothetical protein